ncbi:flagellar hook-associated protein [Campylobacter iguaniorum]|uniref:flagellin N-terminal helical domain-containing protein n=1 Tax=Campylobacter iguaniorum TaxID=1244531 RepID=UPI00073A1F45|nr:flagellin [Campylobacter iguaniorum]ALV24529.1 flagellar hook-associated protein [Campylobacter iguaniorum]
MRVTSQLLNYNTLTNYQTSAKSIYDLNASLTSGSKIQNSYENSGIYSDGTRLEYEVNLLDQIKETTTKATEFSKNSDQALNDFVKQLENFKTKLIQAANEIHDPTSRNAIANDLEGIKELLVNIANTSINGQYLFSGTALNTKPIDSLGNYKGNDQNIQAVIGANQTTTYNIDGSSLFLGADNDYSKILTTNVSLKNNLQKLYDESKDIAITTSDKIMDIIGGSYRSPDLEKMNPDSDFADPTALAQTTFYMQGKKPNGESFSTKFTMTADSSVQTLLDNIGYALGNDKNGINKIVDVTLNNSGQIEIKDVKEGNKLTEFSIFGLTDVEVDPPVALGTTMAANFTNLDDIQTAINDGRVHLTEFIKSGFKTETNSTSSAIDYNDLQLVKKDNTLTGTVSQVVKKTNAYATNDTRLSEVAGGDLLANPESNLTMNITAKDGTNYQVKINFTDPNGGEYPTFSVTRYDANWQTPDADPAYVGNIYNGKYNETTKQTDGISTPANDITYKQLGDIISMVSAGNLPSAEPNVTLNNNINGLTAGDLGSAAGVITALTNGIADADTVASITAAIGTITIFPTDIATVKNAINSNRDFVTARYEEYNKAVTDASSTITAGLNYRGEMEVIDKTKSQTNINVSIFESYSTTNTQFDSMVETVGGVTTTKDFTTKAGSLFSFTSNNAIAIDEPSVDIFKDLDSMIQAVRDGSYRADSGATDSRTTGIQGALKKIDHLADHINKQHTQVGTYTNTLDNTNARVSTLKVNVSSVKSEIINADYGETYLMFMQRLMGYQAMLQASSKMNQISLLNYL